VRSLARWLTTAIDLAIGVASVTAAVVVIGFAVVVVSLHVWRSEPLPNGAIRGVRCHWNGHWLIARGMVANLSDQDATFAVQPDVAVAGGKSVAPNESDFVAVRAGSARPWRWTLPALWRSAPSTAVSTKSSSARTGGTRSRGS